MHQSRPQGTSELALRLWWKSSDRQEGSPLPSGNIFLSGSRLLLAPLTLHQELVPGGKVRRKVWLPRSRGQRRCASRKPKPDSKYFCDGHGEMRRSTLLLG